MNQGYIATISVDFVVVADSETSAKRLALDGLRDILSSQLSVELSGLTYWPTDYEADTEVLIDGVKSMNMLEAWKQYGVKRDDKNC